MPACCYFLNDPDTVPPGKFEQLPQGIPLRFWKLHNQRDGVLSFHVRQAKKLIKEVFGVFPGISGP